MTNRVIVRLKSIEYSGQNIGRNLLFSFQVEDIVTTLTKRIPSGKQGISENILFAKDFSSLDIITLPIQVKITEQEEKPKYNDIGSGTTNFSVSIGRNLPQTYSFPITVKAEQGSDKGKEAIFTFTIAAEVAHATIVVSVVSSYDHNEGIAHKLTIKSMFDERKEEIPVSNIDAVKKEYGTDRPYLEGNYQVMIEPFPKQGEEIGPKPFDKTFQKVLQVKENIENNVTIEITRKQSILHNVPIIFHVQSNPNADGREPLYEFRPMSMVCQYRDIIETEALAQGVDSDLIKAIMYMETTHGYYDKLMEVFDKNKSILPMNVRSDYWRELGYPRKELKKPEINIHVGTLLLKRIADRVQPSSIETIAAVYNDLGTTIVTDYAARVKVIYDDKLWIPPLSFFEQIGEEIDKYNRMTPMQQYELLKRMFGG